MVFLWFLLVAILVVLILILAQSLYPRNLQQEVQIQILQELREIREKIKQL